MFLSSLNQNKTKPAHAEAWAGYSFGFMLVSAVLSLSTLGEYPDDHEQGDQSNESVGSKFADEAHQVLGDGREVFHIRTKDDLHDNAYGDEEQSQVDEFSNPTFYDIDTVHNVHVSSMMFMPPTTIRGCGQGPWIEGHVSLEAVADIGQSKVRR